jgi:hypothetical protein
MKIEEKISRARAIVAETEGKESQTFGVIRGILTEIENELQTLRAQAEMNDPRIFSEEEFATWLGVSPSTLKRARLAGQIKPIMVRGAIRYSTWHQVHIHEIFAPAPFKARKKPGPTPGPPRRIDQAA